MVTAGPPKGSSFRKGRRTFARMGGADLRPEADDHLLPRASSSAATANAHPPQQTTVDADSGGSCLPDVSGTRPDLAETWRNLELHQSPKELDREAEQYL